MHYGLTQTPEILANTCTVLGFFSDETQTKFAKAVDKTEPGFIEKFSSLLKEEGETLWHTDSKNHSWLFIHCGKKNTFNSLKLQKRLKEIATLLIQSKKSKATLAIPTITDGEPNWQLEQMLLQLDASFYQFLDFKTKSPKPHALESLNFYLPNAQEKALENAQNIAVGVRLTRTLANLPANICNPIYLAEQAKELSSEHDNITCKIMTPEDMQLMGMGALLAVAQGSNQPARLIELHYSGGGNTPTVVLVGKGITFDTGGISIKPAASMEEMKFDMSGAASVLGTIKACALLKLPINVVGLMACAENMPSGTATRPGDVVTTMSGQTVEIVNTDAEGRLVLADALTYAERFNPEWVIDLATLTGAMVVALGTINTGFMTKDDKLAKLIEDAATKSQDKAWRMPLDDAYQPAIDSPIADMLNATADRTAGSITAACFLARFTEKYRWAHMDIAGTAWESGKNRNATGRPTPLLVELLRHVAHSR
jgi:leucyl aminopeptidase